MNYSKESFLDIVKVKARINALTIEKELHKSETAKLRVQISRLKGMLKAAEKIKPGSTK